MTETPSHHDIIARVRDLDMAFDTHKGEALTFWAESRKADMEIARALSVIGSQVENIEEKCGRLEDRVLAYDRMRDKVIGALAAGGLFIGALWWMTKDALGKLFGVTP